MMRLQEYIARRTHPSMIKEPLLKAAWWRRREMAERETAYEARKWPSEFGHLADDASHEAEYARTMRSLILSHLWEDRIFNRALAR